MDCSFKGVMTMILAVLWASFKGLAWAQNTTQSTANLFVGFPLAIGFSDIAVAAVVESNPTATTYLIGCPTPTACAHSVSEEFDFCNIVVTATQGLKTFRETATVSISPFFAVSWVSECELDGTTAANCSCSGIFDFHEEQFQETMSSSERYAGADVATMFQQIPLVANTDQIYTKQPRLTETSLSTEPTSSTQIVAVSALSAASAALASPSFAAATSTRNAGTPQITGHAGWAVGGLAAAVLLGGL